jgi:hypothetical protein
MKDIESQVLDKILEKAGKIEWKKIPEANMLLARLDNNYSIQFTAEAKYNSYFLEVFQDRGRVLIISSQDNPDYRFNYLLDILEKIPSKFLQEFISTLDFF